MPEGAKGVGEAGKFDPMVVEWQARENDLIGGWCITPLTDPRSPAEGAFVIADAYYYNKGDLAKHIAHVHNTWLEDVAEGRGPDARA